jgi:protein TonB
MRLADFMPYGAPELLASARTRMVRALALSSLLGVLLFAVAWSLIAWLGGPALPGQRADNLTRVLLETPPPPALEVAKPPPAVAPAPALKAAAVPVPVAETQAPPDQTVMSQEEMRETAPQAASAGAADQPGDGPANQPGEVALVDRLPEPIRAPQPAYPDLARQAHVEGLVIVHALVGKDGRVKEVQLHPRTHVPMLDQAALDAARRWSFRPALQSGHPVSVWVAVPFRFRLH